MPIGAHVGVADGYAQAVDYAVSVGCECIQIFAKSPRQWHARPMDPEVASAFRARVSATGTGPVLVHTAYLINLGSADDALWERSWLALGDELLRAGALGARFVVTHVGTAPEGPDAAAVRIAEGVKRALGAAGEGDVRLLLENTAGAGSSYGSTPTELGAVLSHLGAERERVGVCLDTCHAHAAGWDLSSRVGWDALLGRFESECCLPEAVHANDCMFAVGSKRDRHAWIGDGQIGEGFVELFADRRLGGVPIVTEMPGEVPAKDEVNITRLKRLRDAFSERA